MATDICYPVIKYSFATGVRQDASVPWQHRQSESLFVIIKGSDTRFPDGRLRPDGKLDMRVVDRTQVLESVDIARYIDEAIDTRRHAQEAGIAAKIEQLPIFGITQDSLLAIRYRLIDGQARRLQLRLEDSAKCKQIVSVFERRGMEFQEKRPRTARPGTAGSTSTATADRRFTSCMNSGPPHPEQVPQSQIYDHGSRQPSSSDGLRSTTVSTSRPVWLTQDAPAPPPYTRDENAAARNVMPDRPTTSQLYRMSTMPNQHSQVVVDVMAGAPFKPERPSSSSHLSTVERVRNAVEEDGTPPDTPLTLADILRPSEISSETLEPGPNDMHSSDPAQILTSITTVPPPESQEFELPPRRQLPFKRPDSKHSRPGKVSDFKSPPLPRSKPTQSGIGRAMQYEFDSALLAKNSTARPSTASPLKRSFAAVEGQGIRPQTSVGLQSTPTKAPSAQPSLSQTPVPAEFEAAKLTSQPRHMDELLNGRKPLVQRTTNTEVPRINSLADAEHEIDPQYSPSKRQALSTHDPITNAYAAVRAPADPGATSLEEYATQSFQDRQAALEQFMVSNLENPAFAKLCEDIENCWRKVALGL